MLGMPKRAISIPGALAFLLAAAPLLGGCIEAAVATGAGVTATGVQDRGIKGAANDQAIRAEITHAWLQKDHGYISDFNLQVYEGRVLVSGAVGDPAKRADAVERARSAKGVRELIDEVQVTSEGGVGSYAVDSAIVTELNARLLFELGADSYNYSVESVLGSVYLLGIAQSQQELDKAVNIARNIRNVKRVVSHVLLKDDPRRFGRST